MIMIFFTLFLSRRLISSCQNLLDSHNESIEKIICATFSARGKNLVSL